MTSSSPYATTRPKKLGSLNGLHWSIPDPAPIGTIAAFDATFEQLTRRVSDLAPRLTAS
jgi:hypothetical protein